LKFEISKLKVTFQNVKLGNFESALCVARNEAKHPEAGFGAKQRRRNGDG
jgi:hypothetical protein